MSQEDTKELYGKIDDLTAKVNRLISYLDSDPATNRRGIVEKVDKLNETVNELLTREKVYKAKAAAYGGFVGGIVVIAWKIFTFVFPISK